MASSKLKVPILLEWNDIQAYMEKHDIVEVVRCKDCKYSEIDNPDFPDQYLCNHNGMDWNPGDHFCSYGEKVTE